MKITNTKIILIAVIGLAILACVFAVWKLYLPAPQQAAWLPASSLPKHQLTVTDNKWFWIKDNTIYYGENPMDEADISTFVASSISPYGKDKNNVYYCTQIVANLDPATFTVLDGVFGKDASHVVYGGYYLVSGADAATFSVVPQSSYAKDKYHVYGTWRELPGADPVTFEIVPPNAARDKNWIYVSDAVFGPASLITDNTQYSKALPVDCNLAGAEPIQPQVYPGAFSANGNVIGYTNASRACVIDKKAGTVQSFPYGFSDSVSLSKDGSKVLFFKYQKGDGVDGETCADCGQYSYDRATGKVQRVL